MSDKQDQFEAQYAEFLRDIRSRLRRIPGKRFGQWCFEWEVAHGMRRAQGWTFTERGARREMGRALRSAERRRDNYATRNDGWVES